MIRSDLRSRTGYARAARALGALLTRSYDLVGVDIHPDPDDCNEAVEFRTVEDTDLPGLLANARLRPIVLHHTGPDDFRLFPGAYNIGAFYWETDAVPYARAWSIKLNLMDAIWAPTGFVAEFARKAGFQGVVETVTWPHELGPVPERSGSSVPDLPVDYLAAVPGDGAPVPVLPMTLVGLRTQADLLFVAIQSLAPRKGTRLLLNEWRSYIRSTPCRDVLLLRLSFRHATDVSGEPLLDMAGLLRDAGFQPGEAPQIALIPHAVTDDTLRQLYRCCDAYVSATYGEGYGGPIVEALQQACPVIAPRHTGIKDLLAEDYPLIVESRSIVVGLKGGIPAYPLSANWHVPQPGAVAARLRQFATMSPAERAAAAMAARSHVAAVCSTQIVRQQLRNALAGLMQSPVRTDTSAWPAA